MNSHIIYDQIAAKVDLTRPINVQSLCLNINALSDKEKLETIYSLILHHWFKEGNVGLDPYNCLIGKNIKSITCYVQQLPPTLIHIINGYLTGM